MGGVYNALGIIYRKTDDKQKEEEAYYWQLKTFCLEALQNISARPTTIFQKFTWIKGKLTKHLLPLKWPDKHMRILITHSDCVPIMLCYRITILTSILLLTMLKYDSPLPTVDADLLSRMQGALHRHYTINN